MAASPERIARLRAAIAEGSYAPGAEAVAESLVGWLAPPEWFEGRPAVPTRDLGPLDRGEAPVHTAGDVEPRR